MSKLYSFFDRRKNIIQPLMGRQRMSFKGVVESEKINLHLDQFIADIARLHEKLGDLDAEYQQVSTLLDSKLDSATPRLL